jgi:hypothetical protein
MACIEPDPHQQWHQIKQIPISNCGVCMEKFYDEWERSHRFRPVAGTEPVPNDGVFTNQVPEQAWVGPAASVRDYTKADKQQNRMERFRYIRPSPTRKTRRRCYKLNKPIRPR